MTRSRKARTVSVSAVRSIPSALSISAAAQSAIRSDTGRTVSRKKSASRRASSGLSAVEEKREKNEALREQAEAERAAAFAERRTVSRERFDALVRALEERLGIRVRFERTAEGGCLCLTEEKKEGERI